MPNTDYTPVYNAVKLQNDILIDQKINQRDTYSTDNQKIKYQSANINFYYALNQILWWVYYLIILGVFYCIVFGKASQKSIFSRTILVIFIIIFPYVIIPIETFLYWLLSYFYAVMTSTVYNKPKYDMPSVGLTSYA
jgi:uncharacterized membrane protein